MSTRPYKPLTPRLSVRVTRFAMDNYAAFYTATWLTRRDAALIEAKFTTDPERRAECIDEARVSHRSFLRCLREARREGLINERGIAA